MIASPPFADNLSRIHLDGLDDSKLVELLRDEGYERGDAYGFTVEETERSLVTAYLLLSRAEVRQVFNEETRSVEEQKIQIVETIPFRVDFKYGILEIFANKDSVSSVTNKLGQLTNWETTIENAVFSPQSIVKHLEDEYRTKLISIKISNYSITDSVVGDLSANVNDQEEGQRLLEEYTGDVSYVGTRVNTGDQSVTIGIYDSGSVVVYNEIGGLTEVLDLIKNSTVGGDNA